MAAPAQCGTNECAQALCAADGCPWQTCWEMNQECRDLDTAQDGTWVCTCLAPAVGAGAAALRSWLATYTAHGREHV